MASNWYPETPTGRMWAEVTVEDSGFGSIAVRRLDDRYADPCDPYDRPGLFAGPRMAALLDVVTGLATGADERPAVRVPATYGEPLVIEQADAAGFLPVLQRATVLAAAGEERYERVWPDVPPSTQPPLCVFCNLGSDYADAVTGPPWPHPGTTKGATDLPVRRAPGHSPEGSWITP